MSDGDALFSAILAEPEEDVPRLAFADWLDETGGEFDRARAEFVRAQVALARIPPAESVAWNPRVIELRAREQALVTAYGRRWIEPLRGRGGPLEGTEPYGQFRRGFVEVVWMPAVWFVARAPALFARTPARELSVTRTTVEELGALAGSAYLPRLTALELIDRRLGDDAARVLVRHPRVAALAALRLIGCGLTDTAAYRLADAPFPWPLRELDVRHNPISATGLAVLRDRFGPVVIASPPPGWGLL
jgi:uncharacterized protein (TIGR02996 family)